MKKSLRIFFNVVSALSIAAAMIAASCASLWMSYQPECPEELIK